MKIFFGVGYEYREAYNQSSPSLKRIIRKYLSMPKGYRERVPLLWHILKGSTQPFKMAKEKAKYTEYPNRDQKCENCIFYYVQVVEKRGVCTKVRGDVKSNHWCKFWKGLNK